MGRNKSGALATGAWKRIRQPDGRALVDTDQQGPHQQGHRRRPPENRPESEGTADAPTYIGQQEDHFAFHRSGTAAANARGLSDLVLSPFSSIVPAGDGTHRATGLASGVGSNRGRPRDQTQLRVGPEEGSPLLQRCGRRRMGPLGNGASSC